MNLETVLTKYREFSTSKRSMGDKFERLIQAFLKTDPKYTSVLEEVWMWDEFPSRYDFGVTIDTGIDLVGKTFSGEYWAIQCKFYSEDRIISKGDLDTFISSSNKKFYDDRDNFVSFTNCLLFSTTYKWGKVAEQTIRNQMTPIQRINLSDLKNSPVDWLKLDNGLFGMDSRDKKYDLLEHQQSVLSKTIKYFEMNDRGKLIMACGTGKTFTSLKIAERQTNNSGLILFLVPSIALLGQTLNEWTAQSEKDISPILICSDPKINKKTIVGNDNVSNSIVDLALPASTDVCKIANQLKSAIESKDGMTVVFSTYQSIGVVSEVQKEMSKSSDIVFDLVIADEAHRTTGVTLSEEDESYYVRVHKDEYINAKKRLYMTATPRLYSDESKSKASENNAVLCSMDDEDLYGDEIERVGFGEAVEKNLLADYKVLILTLNEKDVSPSIQKMISNEEHEIDGDDAAKLIGCINALSKQVLGDEGVIKDVDPKPMKRAVAFTNTIKNSRKITRNFNESSIHYLNDLPLERRNSTVRINSQHIDGSMSAVEREGLMNWLKDDSNIEEDECRILSNVRCLSEGVDVPSLDAVMFLSARNSTVDVVQSVGRVMRKAPNKKYGYIIIPVIVPSDVDANEALDKNERYKVVWSVLNALRAHDDRFNATINKIDLNKKKPDNILIGRPDAWWEEDEYISESQKERKNKESSIQMQIQFNEIQNVMFAKMVKKVGDRLYWEQWAKDVADIAERNIDIITNLVKGNSQHKDEFKMFLEGLRRNINPTVTSDEAIEMLSQHIITKPVFEALFDDYSFVNNNPVSVSMQNMIMLLEEELDHENVKLDQFYESVKLRAKVDNAEAKQRIIIELYDKFFKTAFPKMVDKLGIVYTPIEIVDFIIASVNDILRLEFGRDISEENIHILDPFTGTGTFITRIIQSGLIPEDLIRNKYEKELHANEIVLLAYYIAAINIENAFHEISEKSEYLPFEGICLTDTFQLGEESQNSRLNLGIFPKNSERVETQKNTPITVIVGNPPYSSGQKNENDNAQNQVYEFLHKSINETYAKESVATSKIALYDSYIKAFRWSSNRLDKKNGGVIAFITNSGWLDGLSMDGFRKTIAKEFDTIHVLNLRGGVRGKNKESAKLEGQNVFDIMTGVAIVILVKRTEENRNCDDNCEIQYSDIGSRLTRKEKLSILKERKSIMHNSFEHIKITPNADGDWLNQRSEFFKSLIVLGDKKNKSNKDTAFEAIYSNGVKSNRDAWVYSSNREQLIGNVKSTVDFYNLQKASYSNALEKNKLANVKDIVSYDDTRISWSGSLIDKVKRGSDIIFDEDNIVSSLYRPFFKQHLYFSRDLNERVYLMKNLFPTKNSSNKLICVSGLGGKKKPSVIMTDCVPDVNLMDAGAQCFPLYYYEKNDEIQQNLFSSSDDEYIRKSGISSFMRKLVKKTYGVDIFNDDIFYYVYGILHSVEYNEKFCNDLTKSIPRIPLPAKVQDFWSISKIGRLLSDLHLDYENVEPYDGVDIDGSISDSVVTKMKFKKNKGVVDTSTIIVNDSVKISGIPSGVYEFVVNGKSPIEWIVDRYRISTDRRSGIENDPNRWHPLGGEYIVNLILRVITVCIESTKLINSIPLLQLDEE